MTTLATPIIFQEELKKEIKKIFSTDLFPDPKGNRIPLNVYEQQLPVRKSEDDPDPFPYALVRLENGDTDVDKYDGNNRIYATVLVGMINQSEENNGHKDVLNVIWKIYERFSKNPALAGKAVFTDRFQWALQDEESFPYFFGAASLVFNIASVRREDKFA